MQPFDIKSLPAPLRTLVINIQRLWFAWCCLITLVVGLFLLLPYFIVFNFIHEANAKKYAHWITRLWGKSILAFMLIKVSSEGEEKLQDQAQVIVSNHASLIDIPVCMSTSPVQFSFLAKIEVDKIPIVGYLARNMHVYVDRKSFQSRKQTFDRMKKHLNDGHSILIYPEGTRNRSEALLNGFYDGAFKLAIENQKPVTVVTICGSDKANSPKYPFQASPAWIHCIWEDPISTVGMTVENDLKRLKQIARDRMLANLESYNTSLRLQ